MKPVPLLNYPVGATDAGAAMIDDFEHTVVPLVSDLLDAGYDPRHIESLMCRAITWTITLATLMRAPRSKD